MTAFVLVVNFVIAFVFCGYTGGWKLFDFWWSGGAVICGALLFGIRPIRFHRLGIFLLPAILILWMPGVVTSSAVQNSGWWVVSLFLFIFLPTLLVSESGDRVDSNVPEILFETLRWCGASLTLLYIIQSTLHFPVRGVGLMRSAEAQVILGGLACCFTKKSKEGDSPRASKIFWIFSLVLGLCLNGSRSGVLGLGVLLAGYVWQKTSSLRPVIWSVILTLVLVLVITFERIKINPFAELRPQIYLLALNIFAENPLGTGPGTFFTDMLYRNFPVSDPTLLSQYAKVNNHAHNVVLQWGAEGGILGMATALAFLVCGYLLLLKKSHLSDSNWTLKAAVLWGPAFLMELMINVTETLSPIRWMGLAGIVALTPDCSVILLRRSHVAFRLGVISLGALFLYFGINDLLARQAIRIGMKEEGDRQILSAFASYEEAYRRRPWDEQPILHMAQAADFLGKSELADAFIQKAFLTDDSPGAVLYHGAQLYLRLAGNRRAGIMYQKGRHFMFSMSELQACDIPRVIEAVPWSRSEAERRWRLRRILSFEPRAARIYADLSSIALGAGDKKHAENFSDLAGRIRDFYWPGIRLGLAEYSILNKNTARYDVWLIDKPNSL